MTDVSVLVTVLTFYGLREETLHKLIIRVRKTTNTNKHKLYTLTNT